MLMPVTGRSTIGLLVLTAALVIAPETATAQADVVCAERDESTDVCLLELTVELEGDPPMVAVSVSGDGVGRQVLCDRGSHYDPDPQQAQLREVPCSHPEYGWYSSTYDCYFNASDTAPNAGGVILPVGYRPGDPGAVYKAMCFTASHPDIRTSNYCFCVPPGWNPPPQWIFLESPPDGFGGTADPVPGLLVSAIEELGLEGPAIGTAPPAGQGAGLVRLPVWLWNEVSGNNWGTPSQTVGPIAGISVVARAAATGIEWDMGDGNTIRCDEGVAWQRGMNLLDPPCGYPYPRASRDRPGGVYEVSATTTWALEWWTEGMPEQRGGEFVLRATSTTALQIDEVQVVNAG
jgi:hypothetical protein